MTIQEMGYECKLYFDSPKFARGIENARRQLQAFSPAIKGNRKITNLQRYADLTRIKTKGNKQ